MTRFGSSPRDASTMPSMRTIYADQTALHPAAIDGGLDLIRLLHQAGADPSLRGARFRRDPPRVGRTAGRLPRPTCPAG